MTRFRPTFSILITSLFFILLIQSSVFALDPDCPPVLTLPEDSSVFFCTPGEICFDVIGNDPEVNDTLVLSLVSGPMDFPPETFYGSFTRKVCFYPATSGVYVFIWQLKDRLNIIDVDTVVFDVTVNTPPVIEDQEFSQELCLGQRQRELPVTAFDADNDELRFEKLSGPGTIDENTGVISYEVTSSGVTSFEVAVYDPCGADTATVTDYVYLNEPPQLLTRDTTIILCEPVEICFDVVARDPEGGPVTITEIDDLGQFTPLNDTSGQTCFMPADVDTAVYRFIYCLVDQCPLDKITPPCLPDTIIVTVIINLPPYFTLCPESQEFNTCAVDTFCFEVSANDPEFGPLTYRILEGNAFMDDKKVCVIGEESQSFDVVIEVSDYCNATDTCTVPVVINGNRPPVIQPLADQNIFLCQPEIFCFEASVSDDDYNLDTVMLNYGYYDSNLPPRICIEIDTSGVYTIILTARDDCGATDVDTALVTVEVNRPPVAEFISGDTSLVLCEISELCFKANINDDNIKHLYISHGGYFNEATGEICFTPTQAGEYKLSVYLEDYCNLVATDTITVAIQLKDNEPVFSLNDTTVFLCTPDYICLPVTITDADNDIMSIVPSRGTYENGRLCFVPYNLGDIKIALTVTDSCNHVVTDTCTVTVVSDDVHLVCPGDTSVFLCEPENLCFPIGGIPDGATVKVFGTNVTYNPETRSVCFFSDCCLQNNIRVEVTTPCSTYTCGFTVDIQTNSAPAVRLPADTTFWSCQLQQVCLPVSVEDIDRNVASVLIEGAVYDDYYQTACFTPESEGEYVVSVTAYDSCGAYDGDTVVVTVATNRPPVIEYTLEDSVFRVCSFEEICIPLSITDPDNNLSSITVGSPFYINTDTSVCFIPDRAGDYCMTVQAADLCGVITARDICVTVEIGDSAWVTCPTITEPIQLCQSDTVDIDITVAGVFSNLTVAPEDIAFYDNGKIHFRADTTGTYEITVTAEAECNTSSCILTVPVEILTPVSIVCPDSDSLFECEIPHSINIPMEIYGDYTGLDIIPAAAEYIPGQGLNIPVDSAGFYEIRVIAVGLCNADTCEFSVTLDINQAPVVEVKDTTVVLCDLEPVCVPVNIYDVDNAITAVIVEPFGELLDGRICFTPTAFENYTFLVIATDECESADTAYFTVSVMKGDYVDIECPGNLPDTTICGSQLLCHDLNITGLNYQIGVYPENVAFYENGQLCFMADTTGFYEITVIGYAGCNNDTCVVTRQITVTDSVFIVCPDEQINLFECFAPYSVNIPVKIIGDYTDLQISPQVANFVNDTLLNIPTSGPGVYPVEIIATGPCNADTCAFTVNLNVNQPPELTVQADTTVTVCTLEGLEIQVKFHLFDPDNNIEFYGANPGQINDSIVYFYPTRYGEQNIVVFAEDTCGARVEDTVKVTVVQGPTAVIENCPQLPLSMDMENFPTTIRYELPITPGDAVVEVTGGTWANDTLAVEITAPGTYHVNVTATALCGSDECNLTFVINEYVPPGVVCHDTMAVLCLLEPQMFCVGIDEITGTDITVSVSRGQYIDGRVCFEVSEPGEYDVEIIVANEFEGEPRADTCNFTATIDGGRAPVVNLGEDFNKFLCGPEDFCFEVEIIPGDFNIIGYELNYGTFNGDTKELCLGFDTAGTYHLVLKVFDDCGNTAEDDIYITVIRNIAPTVDLGDDFATLICAPTDICLDIDTFDVDNNIVSVYPVGNGYINDAGQVCFTVDTAGTYRIIVRAVDACEAFGDDTVLVTVTVNRPPVISPMPDTTVFLCAPTYVCLPVTFSDPDNNIASVVANRGKYKDGQLCFVPYDSGNYVITLTVTDSCGLKAMDTAIVRILTEQSISIQCPNDTTVFLCQPENLCFPIKGIPEGASVKVYGTNVTYDAATESVCFFSDCCLDNEIRVEVTTACSTYTCEFTVFIQTNSKPVVRLPKDATYLQCWLQPVCVPVAVTDIDRNVESIVVSGAVYDAYYQTACLTPDTPGTYTIRVTAYDSCDASGFDEIKITVIENSAPIINVDITPPVFRLCTLEEICFTGMVDDPDDNLKSVEVWPNGWYDFENNRVCFIPEAFGVFWLHIRATDTCDAVTVDSLLVTIDEGDFVDVICPEGPIDTVLCEASSVCIPVDIVGTPLPDVGDGYKSIRTYPVGLTSYSEGNFCFIADSSGTYTLTLVAEAQCNKDSCTFIVNVDILEPLAITCPASDSVFLCDTTTLVDSFTISSSVTEVMVSDTAAVKAYIVGNKIYIPVRQEGERRITLTAKGRCGEVSCDFTIKADFNTPPLVVAGNDTTLVECELFPVCVKFSVFDPDGNLDSMKTTHGTFDDTLVCFNPADYGGFGDYNIIVTAFDACNTMDADTLRVSFLMGDSAKIEWCPEELYFSSCWPDTVYFPLNITPADAQITILPNGRYEAANKRVGVFVDTAGTYLVSIAVNALCYDTACSFPLYVERFEFPQISCPGNIDTLLCLSQPDTICFPIDVQGTAVDVTILPAQLGAYYTAGHVCVPVSAAGTYPLTIIGSNMCGSDTCSPSTVLNVNADQPPLLFLPDDITVERCPNDTDLIVIRGIYATDVEAEVIISQVCGPEGAFVNIQPDSGVISFRPTEINTYAFCFEADDGCQVVKDTLLVHVTLRDDCDVCLRVYIDGGSCTPVGLRKLVELDIETNDAIAGFDLLLKYDVSALTFINATIAGSAISAWEYFTYRVVSGSQGLLRLVGIADINNGPNHPPASSLRPDGVLVYIEYQIANNQNLGDVFIPISFIWYDCGDNTFSDVSGTILFMDSRIYNAEGILIWDEDINQDGLRTPELGAYDACLAGTEKGVPLRCIEFFNGGICITHPDSLDDRGDINLNNIAYEIADAVLFTSYFVRGLGVFNINLAGQIAATDVNADGITLTVADLVYLVRIIIGDADPYPKIVPYQEELLVTTEQVNERVCVTTDAVSTIGAACFVYDINGSVDIGEPCLSADAAGMEIQYAVENNQLKILVYNIGTHRIQPGIHQLMEIPISGEGMLNLVKAEIADYHGQPYKAVSKNELLPAGFILSQNYPNPFNPSTRIEFSLPVAAEWHLTIFNVTGKIVREYSGYSESGTNEVTWDGTSSDNDKTASGVYFYRLECGKFSETKKMILLK